MVFPFMPHSGESPCPKTNFTINLISSSRLLHPSFFFFSLLLPSLSSFHLSIYPIFFLIQFFPVLLPFLTCHACISTASRGFLLFYFNHGRGGEAVESQIFLILTPPFSFIFLDRFFSETQLGILFEPSLID